MTRGREIAVGGDLVVERSSVAIHNMHSSIMVVSRSTVSCAILLERFRSKADGQMQILRSLSARCSPPSLLRLSKVRAGAERTKEGTPIHLNVPHPRMYRYMVNVCYPGQLLTSVSYVNNR